MKLFASSEGLSLTLSTEEFRSYYDSAAVISTESVNGYLNKIKDGFYDTLRNFGATKDDKPVQEALSRKFETQRLAKTVKLVNFRHAVVSKPESFKGLYVEYLEDLVDVAHKTRVSLDKSSSHLKIAIASFINEYSDDKVDSLYGEHYFKQEAKVIDEQKKKINRYFTDSDNKVKAHPDDVLRSMTDFEAIYRDVETLSSMLNIAAIKAVEKDVRDITDLIDSLIDQNLKSGVLTRNTNTKRELIDAIHQTAEAVEFFNGLYANLLFFCGAFKSLVDALHAQPEQ